jgi:GntR family transcriptional regulator, carbon starvation induced regulator
VKVPSNGQVISKTNETYQMLRNAILWGELPAGSRLRTNVLTKEYDISLGALREALSRLSAEGLTQAEAHRGYVVTPISAEDVEDLARVRTAVETQCLVWAIEKGSLDWESNIVAATHRLVNSAREFDQGARPAAAWTQAHADYHAALVGGCGSPRLLQIRNSLYEQSERHRRLELSIPHNRNADDEHRQLAEAAISRDIPRATRLMHDHINRTTAFIVRALTEREAFETAAHAPAKRMGVPTKTTARKASATKAPAAEKAASAKKTSAARKTPAAKKMPAGKKTAAGKKTPAAELARGPRTKGARQVLA